MVRQGIAEYVDRHPLPTVSKHYFFQLKDTHARVATEMPGDVRAKTAPWFAQPESRLPIGNSIVDLIKLLPNATDGAYATYIAMVAGHGRETPTETLAEIAIRSSLQLALHGIMRDVRYKRTPDHSADTVGIFNDQVAKALATGDKMEAETGLWKRGQEAALALAAYIHERSLDSSRESERLLGHFDRYSRSTTEQFEVGSSDSEDLIRVARETGETIGLMALNLVQIVDKNFRILPNTSSAAAALGRQGALNEHGSLSVAIIKNRIPTYGAAELFKHLRTASPVHGFRPGNISDALAMVATTREFLVGMAYEDGRHYLDKRQERFYSHGSQWMGRYFRIYRARQDKSALTVAILNAAYKK